MPWIVPSHPAPVLPLKLWKPHAFSGLALCLGAMAPDLEFILRLDRDWIVSHTFAAQLFFTVPLVLLLHALLTSVVLGWLAPLLPCGPPWHLEDLARLRPASGAVEWVRVAVSGFIGGASHVFIDGFTHGNHSGWALAFVPSLAVRVPLPGGGVALHDLLQVVLTLVLGAMGVRQALLLGRGRWLARWNPHRASAVLATSAERRGALGYFAVCAGLGILAGVQRTHDGAWIERGALGGLAFLFYGLCLAALADRVRVSWAARRAGLGATEAES